LPMVPSSTASTSMVALSVSISAMTSPEETLSPSLTCHLARVPSSMVGDSAGMVMLMGIELAPVGDGVYGGDHLVDVRQRQFLEVSGVGHGHVLAGDAGDRGIEIVEGLLHDAGGEFGADGALRPAFFDSDQPAGLFHR